MLSEYLAERCERKYLGPIFFTRIKFVKNPGKFHRSGGHSKCNCLQDPANFHRSQAWKIVLIFSTGKGSIVLALLWQGAMQQNISHSAAILLSMLISVASDLFNDILWMDNELSARLSCGWSLWSVNRGENTDGSPANCLMKLVNLMACNFDFWGRNHSKFYSNMQWDFPEAYEKFQLISHNSFWMMTNWINYMF